MKLTCSNCGTRFYFPRDKLSIAVKSMIYHRNVLCSTLKQNKPLPEVLRNIHRPYSSFAYWMYKTLKVRSMIPIYMTWDEWSIYEFIKWSGNTKLYNEWHESLRYTCYNSPCPMCLERAYQRTTSDKRTYAKGNRLEVKQVKPKGFIQHANGRIEYLK